MTFYTFSTATFALRRSV